MENRREELLGIKRFFIGILIGALLLTMTPLENIGSIIAKAADATISETIPTLGDTDLFVSADVVEITDTNTIDMVLAAAEGGSYPNGVIMLLTADVDYAGGEMLVPGVPVGIDMGSYSITNVKSIAFSEVAAPSTDAIYGYNLFIAGDGINSKIVFQSTESNIWSVNANQQLVLTDVDIVNADILVSASETDGSAFGYNEIYYTLPKNYDETTYEYSDWFAMYREGEGMFRYEGLHGTLYVDKLYSQLVEASITDGVFHLQLDESIAPVEINTDYYVRKWIYAKDVMEYIATEGSNCKLGCFDINIYENPKVGLIVDSGVYGVYTITDETTDSDTKHVMTVYEYIGGFRDIQEDENSDITAILDISEYFFEGNGSEAECTFDEVVFVEGAIPMTYETEITEGDVVQTTEYPVTTVQLWDANRGEPEFIFDFTGITQDIQVFNISTSDISIVDNDTTSANEIWVQWNVGEGAEYPLEIENATISEIETKLRNDYLFAKAGTTFTVTPTEGYTLSGIQLGDCGYYEGDMGKEYYYNSGWNLVNTDLVKINTDRSVVVTIPTRKAAFFASGVKMNELSLLDEAGNAYASVDTEPMLIDTEVSPAVAWHSGTFTVDAYGEDTFTELEDGSFVKTQYEISDMSEPSDTSWAGSLMVSEECTNKEQVFYVIDRSMQKDITDVDGDKDTEEVIPTSTYGQITKLTHTYSMDLASPRITGLSATDGDGNELILDGEWVEAGGNAPDLDIVWTNKVPVTISVLTDDADVIGYAYSLGIDPEEDDWTEINSTELTVDNNYNLFFYVRDAFDAVTGRLEGEWRTSLGIDTTSPVINYRDANYAPEGSEQTEVVETSEYEGNLYLTVIDYGAGTDTVTLYRDNGGTWVENQESLIDEGFGGYYHIVPTTEDVTYKVVATDIVGNSKIYENIVLKGYTQDISVEVTGTNSRYGEGQTISIAITNTSENPVTGLTYALRSGVTNEVFGDFSGSIDSIAAGATETLTLTLDSTTDAGTYDAVLDINYLSEGGTDETNVQKVLTEVFSAVIEKVDGSGSITVEDYYFGQPFTYTLNSTTHETGTATFYFKDAADENAEYSTEEPTAAGTYMVKAVVPETTNYNELSVETTFTITRIEATADMYSFPEADEVTGWYNGQVIITPADGYTIAETEDGAFGSELIINSSVENYQFYVRTPDGAITSAVTIAEIKIDMEAPVLTYTDANNREGATLASDIEVEGNLYFIVEDAGAGVGSVTLYEDVNGTWTENADALFATTTENEYFIVSTDTDVKYRIEAADVIGNEVVYDNITMKAYTQDLSAIVGETSGRYGAELNIDITITNASAYSVQITEIGLREEETDDVFALLIGEVNEISAGATWSTTLQLPAGTDIGTYQAVLDVAYTTNAGYQEGNIAKTFSQTISATIGKSTGTATITIKDFYYGEEVSFVVESTTNDASAAIFYYRDASVETAEFSTEVPSEEGSYQVQVVLPANENYEEVVLTDNFNITRLSATTEMYELSGTVDENGQYVGTVTVTAAEGYTISETEDGTYGSSLVFDSTVESFSFYIKTETGAITNEVVLSMKQVDTTAPVIYYTDANNATRVELKADTSYMGNVYLTVEDTASEVANVKLYEKIDGQWVENIGALIPIEGVNTYYIAPSAEAKTYRLEATDEVGNVATYDNITVVAYTQDIQFAVENITGVYGEELEIAITINVTGSNAILVNNLALQPEETDSVFISEIPEVAELGAGTTHVVYIKLPKGTDAGEYTAVVDIAYVTLGGSKETEIAKECSQTITATIEKAEGTGSIIAEDFYYGEKFTYKVESATNGAENVSLYFREEKDTTAEFTAEMPTQAGSYMVKAVIPETQNYKGLEVTDVFEIKRMAATAQMYSISESEGSNGWSTKDVVITAAEGYLVSATENGPFAETLSISNSVKSYTFYIKTQTGAITSAVVLTDIKIDKTAPKIGVGEGIYAAETWWQRFLETITFNLYEAESTQVRIKAHDEESGIAKISYYVSESPMTLSDVRAIRNWTTGSQFTISIEDYERFVIYAKIENQAGLVTYISSNGIELEAEEEEVTVIQGGTVSLQKGKAYRLGEGTWNVSGDATNYAGGITFYVSEDGDYNFTQR